MAGPDPSSSSQPPSADAELSRAAEIALARAVARGDPAALEQLHAHYFDAIYRFIDFRTGGVRETSEEIAQDTFLAALEGLRRYRGEAALFTWLCGIAKNKLARVKEKETRLILADALERLEPEIDRILTSLEAAELPEEALEREETRGMVGATMATLPLRYQNALLDKYVHARSVDAMARASGESVKTVESMLTRARSAFRRTFELLARDLRGGALPRKDQSGEGRNV